MRALSALTALTLSSAGAWGCSDSGPVTDAGTPSDGAVGDADAPDAATPDAGDRLSTDYCACMLVECHTVFHETWGPTDMGALTACAAEAATLPRAGMPASSGNSIECRLARCDGAGKDPDVCSGAVGGDPCM